MATFPAYAQLEVSGYHEKPESALLRTKMEGGPPKQARIKTRVTVARTVTALLESKTDYLNFKAWFRDTINHGADWFQWTDPVDEATKDTRIKAGSFEGGAPVPGCGIDGLWEVKFTLETWE